RIYVDRDESLGALETRLKRRRNYFLKSAEKGFDEDDDFWARGLANWAEEQGVPPLDEARELVGGLFLEVAKQITTEDSMKIREMYLDIESRRQDTREAAEESRARLEQTWELFRDLEPKLIVNDEQLFRELKDRFGSSYGFGIHFQGGMGAESIRDLLRDLDLDAEAESLRETIHTSKG